MAADLPGNPPGIISQYHYQSNVISHIQNLTINQHCFHLSHSITANPVVDFRECESVLRHVISQKVSEDLGVLHFKRITHASCHASSWPAGFVVSIDSERR